MKYPLYALLGAMLAGLFASGPARAMTIENFAKLNEDDESTYVTEMVSGTSDYLKAQGHADQAAKVIALFKDSSRNGGLNQFAVNLKTLFSVNHRNATNPNNREPVYEVEDAMARTLSDAGVTVTPKFLQTFNQNFQSTGPRHPKPPVTEPTTQATQ